VGQNVCEPRNVDSSDILLRIKRAVITGHYAFTEKAITELEADHLSESDALE
jgi:hypothetical protein